MNGSTDLSPSKVNFKCAAIRNSNLEKVQVVVLMRVRGVRQPGRGEAYEILLSSCDGKTFIRMLITQTRLHCQLKIQHAHTYKTDNETVTSMYTIRFKKKDSANMRKCQLFVVEGGRRFILGKGYTYMIKRRSERSVRSL
jgi:hypothetical protein